MKVCELRKTLKSKFKDANIDEIDADYILAHLLNCGILDLITFDEFPVECENDLKVAVDKRLNNMPISKIFNEAFFYGLKFYVNEDVLSPRGDTEILVETAIEEIKNNKYKTVLDLCTGSGAIAISIAKNTLTNVDAADISKKALLVAEKNNVALKGNVNFFCSNMFQDVTNKYDVIVSNPPYIETDVCKTLDLEVKNYDPLIALDGGKDGLEFYRQIEKEFENYLKINGVLLLEIGYNQAESVKEIFKQYNVKIKKDYNGLDRVVIVRR